MPSSTEIRQLIIQGRLETAAESLLEMLDQATGLKEHPDYTEVHDRAVHNLSQLNELNREENMGMGDDRERNRLRLALIDLNRDVKAIKNGERINSDRSDGKSGTGDGRTFYRSWLIAGLSAAAVALFVLWPRAKPEPVDPAEPGETDTISQPTNYGNTPGINIDNPEGGPEAEVYTQILTPITQDMGRPNGKSGHLTSSSQRSASPPQFGDNAEGKEIRGFLTFPLTDLPRNAEIVSADFYMDHGGGIYRELKKVIIDIMDIGERLGPEDFDGPARAVATLALANYDNTKALDLRQEIQLANRNGRQQITLRFRPDELILNRQKDVFAFRYGQGRTRLLVKFK